MSLFPAAPALRLHDPLAELLGAGDDIFEYTFDDAVKLAGHACPTVAGAFLLAHRALAELYGTALPERGGLRVTVHGAPDQGVNGPVSQVLTLLTGAAADTGFHGLAGRHVRKGLLDFDPAAPAGPIRASFTRIDTGASVTLAYDPAAIPPAPAMAADLPAVLGGQADAATLARFRAAWRDRVERLLADGGRSTVRGLT